MQTYVHVLFTARKRSLGQGNIFAPVCHSVHRVVSASMHAGIPPPRADTPRDQTPPHYTPPCTRHSPDKAPPCAVHAGRYSQQAGGLHPTGMQSCYNCQ